MIDADQVHALLDYPPLVEALRVGHLEDIDASEEMLIEQPGPGAGPAATFFALPAWRFGETIGIKIVTLFPENEYTGTGLPSVQAVYVAFDGRDGRPVACVDGTALTLRKTAADSALGTRLLAREDTARMLMVGAGALGPHLIMAHTAVRPSIREVMVWNRTRARAQALAAELSLDGIEITATTDLEAAAREADVISCATMARAPLIEGAWLRSGTHLDLVGGFTPEMREADDEAARRARVYADSRHGAVRCGDILGPLAAGALGGGKIVGDLYDLCQGRAQGRQGPEDITLYKNAGGGHLDLYAVQHLLSRI
jgi:ornithine cyclodeaminase